MIVWLETGNKSRHFVPGFSFIPYLSVRPGKVDSLFLISHFLNLRAGGPVIIITSSKFLEVTTAKAMNIYFLRVKQHGTALSFFLTKRSHD